VIRFSNINIGKSLMYYIRIITYLQYQSLTQRPKPKNLEWRQ